MSDIKLKPLKQISVSIEAFRLFSDSEWDFMLRARGLDLNKQITYKVTEHGCTVTQWDK